MKLAICVLARNESTNIAPTLGQICEQSLFDCPDHEIKVHVVANGCTDDTVEVARSVEALFTEKKAKLQIHDVHPGGKSRAWNLAVHTLVDAELLMFVDADIAFVHRNVLEEMVEQLRSERDLLVFSGHPVKDISRKQKKSPLDQFSLSVSASSRHVDAINGSLYAGNADVFRDIWLPNDTPGEDGFLNAMVTTLGFTSPFASGRVATAEQPTHYFKAHGALEFFDHERRVFLGTMINRWIFEYLWSLNLSSPAGPKIAELNEREPHWVDRIVSANSAGKRWVIPPSILLDRMRRRNSPMLKWIGRSPLQLLAVLVSLPPALAANRRLKRQGAARVW